VERHSHASKAQQARAIAMLKNKYPHRQIATTVGLTPRQVRGLYERTKDR
jgi:predicted transcriptional regulator